jgi:nucleoside phosphorylase
MRAVVSAMPEELAPLVASIPSLQGKKARVGRPLRGKLGSHDVVLACTGEGRERARTETARLLDANSVDLLLGVGTAGGLTPSLESGTLVVASRLHDGESEGAVLDEGWIERALAYRGTVCGTVLTSERILCTAAEKAAAHRRLAIRGPAVVDLESAAFAAEAARVAAPCLIVRAVCDTAEEDLPLDLNLCRDADGGINRFAVARRAMFTPGAARKLLRLRKRVAIVSEHLARFVTALLQEDDRGSN